MLAYQDQSIVERIEFINKNPAVLAGEDRREPLLAILLEAKSKGPEALMEALHGLQRLSMHGGMPVYPSAPQPEAPQGLKKLSPLWIMKALAEPEPRPLFPNRNCGIPEGIMEDLKNNGFPEAFQTFVGDLIAQHKESIPRRYGLNQAAAVATVQGDYGRAQVATCLSREEYRLILG